MKYSQVISLFEETRLSPEKLAKHLNLSGMTLRRWREEPGNKEIPKLYERAIVEMIYQLIHEGRLSHDSPLVKSLIHEGSLIPFESVIRNMGISDELMHQNQSGAESVVVGLSQIGSHESRKEAVNDNRKKILSFKKISKEWSRRISILLTVIKSKQLTAFEKMAAYGALFYLINPLDLIPDHLPVFGLVDDFSIMGFAVVYYLNRFSKLLD